MLCTLQSHARYLFREDGFARHSIDQRARGFSPFFASLWYWSRRWPAAAHGQAGQRPRVVARHTLVMTNRPNIVRLTLDEALHRVGQSAQVGFESSSQAIRTLAACFRPGSFPRAACAAVAGRRRGQ
ncbi:hypothetical protein [Variovorax sp. DT-64]|uniref:hypothetical protein n=1 Tax=Variovorax sp. DT-64 TaxID=3396160 RepID=UPI003F1C27D8